MDLFFRETQQGKRLSTEYPDTSYDQKSSTLDRCPACYSPFLKKEASVLRQGGKRRRADATLTLCPLCTHPQSGHNSDSASNYQRKGLLQSSILICSGTVSTQLNPLPVPHVAAEITPFFNFGFLSFYLIDSDAPEMNYSCQMTLNRKTEEYLETVLEILLGCSTAGISLKELLFN